MRLLLTMTALLGLAACQAAGPLPLPQPLAGLVERQPPGPVRLTLSNFSYARARVESFVTAQPDCAAQAGSLPIAGFMLPLNGTRVIDAPSGADVCWRNQLPVEANAQPGTPRWSGWSRAYTSAGRAIDSSL
ncbi:MAG: hypothetical protein JO267_03895 [Alphaproteobacteria bacterium]|nr:hypothetical protein [Alphaproteobacteria bacterium]